MNPRIEILQPKKLIGKNTNTTLANNKTPELWQSFMKQRAEVKNAIGQDLYSIQVYKQDLDFKDFNPTTEFKKWAAVEVENYSEIPDGMDKLDLAGGLYAVFIHKGPASAFAKTFNHIFGTWLPNSNYKVDNRPHFEVLGSKYKNNDPDSEEEVWIPITLK